jgi:hypothetical protein
MQPSLRLPLPIRPPDGFFSQDVLDQVAISAFIDRRAFRRAAFAHPAPSFALATSLTSAGALLAGGGGDGGGPAFDPSRVGTTVYTSVPTKTIHGMLPKNVFQPDVAAAISAHFRNYA